MTENQGEMSWTQPSPPFPTPTIEFFYLNPDRPTHPSHVRWDSGQFPPMILEIDYHFWRQSFEQTWSAMDYMTLEGRDDALKLIVTGEFDQHNVVYLRQMSDQIKKLDG